VGGFVRTSLGFPDDGSMQKERRKKKEGDLEWASLFVTRVFAFLAHGVAGCVWGGGSVGQAPAQCAPFVEKSSL